MATAVFQIVGTAIARQIAISAGLSAVGTAIATAIGSIIGLGIGNELFPQKFEGQRFTDENRTTSTFGTPIPLVYGNENRISGNVIWSTGLVEKKTTKKVGSFPFRTKVTTYSYSLSCAVALAQGTCKNVKRIWLNKKLAFDASAYSGTLADYTPWTVTSGVSFDVANFYSLSWYPGDDTQSPDPVMEAALGTGEVPAYRGTAYLVFKDLQLADYQNAMPVVEVELEGVGDSTLYSVVEDMCERAGLLSGDYSIQPGLARSTVRGYVVNNAGSAVGAMQPLVGAYGLILAEHRGVIGVRSRNTGAVGTIPIEEMRAISPDDGSATKHPLTIERSAEVDLPKEVSITYLDPDRDYQSNTQKSVRSFGNVESNIAVEFPLVLTDDEAKLIADRALREPWIQRVGVKFTFGPKFSVLNAGNLVSVPIGGRYVSVRITAMTRGDNGVYDVEGIADDQYVFGGSSDGVPAAVPANDLRVVVDSVGYLFNPPILSDDHTDSSYVAVVDNEATNFPGASLYYSTDDSNFSEAATFNDKAIIGTCSTVLGDCPTADLWDRDNSLTVVLTRTADTLESVPEIDVLNGANLAWVGAADGSSGELIQFATATETTTGTWVLSDLLRGRRGTEFATGDHGASEVFVLLDVWADVDYSETDVGKSRYFKFVTFRQDVAAVASDTFTNTGEGGRCRSVAQIATSRDSSNDVTVTWLPRTRFFAPGLGYGPVALGESESYEIDYTNAAGTTVYRTEAVTDRTATYTAAEQTADGLTPGNTVYGYVYQLSASRGRGYSQRFVCT